MGGGLMQLVAYGAQDIYLTGNPQITFFKVVYRRHTNFAMESIEQTFNGTPADGSRVSCTISRNGDLVHKMCIRMATVSGTTGCDTAVDVSGGCCANKCGPLPAGYENANNLIKSVEVEIGGQRIDKQYGDWLNIWAQLTTPASKAEGLQTMLNLSKGTFVYVPLRFWFNRNPGLALPLIALQYHEVKLNIEFGSNCASNGCAPTVSNSTAIASAKLYVEYIYLDTDERRRFAQVSHEYLIEQLQFTGTKSNVGSVSERLNFNHPVKELIWRGASGTSAAEVRDGTGAVTDHEKKCEYSQWSEVTLQLNGHERFAPRHSEYFTHVQPYDHHTAVPVNSGIHCYSFALKPEEHQPSGTCNFSRIDNAVLKLSGSASSNASLNVYAVNYNVLRIMSGMGGLAYSN